MRKSVLVHTIIFKQSENPVILKLGHLDSPAFSNRNLFFLEKRPFLGLFVTSFVFNSLLVRYSRGQLLTVICWVPCIFRQFVYGPQYSSHTQHLVSEWTNWTNSGKTLCGKGLGGRGRGLRKGRSRFCRLVLYVVQSFRHFWAIHDWIGFALRGPNKSSELFLIIMKPDKNLPIISWEVRVD